MIRSVFFEYEHELVNYMNECGIKKADVVSIVYDSDFHHFVLFWEE